MGWIDACPVCHGQRMANGDICTKCHGHGKIDSSPCQICGFSPDDPRPDVNPENPEDYDNNIVICPECRKPYIPVNPRYW